MNMEIKSRIKSIVKTLVFLLIVTLYWYGPRKDIANLAASIGNMYQNRNINVETDSNLNLDNKEVKFTVKNKINKEQNYMIVINNDYSKIRKNNCKVLSNNYLKYELKTEEKIQEEKNLNSDGIIYREVLKPNETKKFTIKIKKDSTENLDSECYYPIINVSTYNEI